MKQSVEVTILGQPFVVRSTEPAEEVRRVASFVNDRLNEVMASGRSADTLASAILALMNVSGRLLRQQEEAARGGDEDVNRRLCILLERLDDQSGGQ
ncbi:MAG: cell division protein ZapA [Trichloromonas sp.]|nr:cell division protein ZapA [Trichloromonas sp.]